MFWLTQDLQLVINSSGIIFPFVARRIDECENYTETLAGLLLCGKVFLLLIGPPGFTVLFEYVPRLISQSIPNSLFSDFV